MRAPAHRMAAAPRSVVFILLLLPCLASAQALILAPDEREAAARRVLLEQLRRAAGAFGAIQKNYVDEVDPGALVERCTQGMQAWLAGRKLPVAAAPTPPANPVERVGEFILRAVEQNEGLDAEKLVDACLQPTLAGLDRLSGSLDRESFRDLQVGSGGAAGIGLELARDEPYSKVVAALDGTPAARADLRPGDRILAIDGVSTEGLSLAEVVKHMRGAPGSTIVLELERPGAGALRRELRREIIRIESVQARLLEDGLLYARIRQFQYNTRERFHAALRELAAQGQARIGGIVLDLRNNAGGLLYSCVGIAAAFLPETALVVELRGRTPDNSRKLFARPQDYGQRLAAAPPLGEPLGSAPLAVLVNRGSAACSEILAAALQDHRRARVIGEQTFGIGTVQTILPLGAGTAIKLTTARYYRPDGSAMEARPVMPDLAVDLGDGRYEFGSAADPALPAARRLLQEAH